MLVLPPRILIARSTLGIVDHATKQTQLTIKLTAYSSEATTATPETISKRKEPTDTSTATNSHTRHAAAASNQWRTLNMFRQNAPSTNARNA